MFRGKRTRKYEQYYGKPYTPNTKPKKLGCAGCPICGTGHCRETGPIEDCTNHVSKRVKAQYPDLPLKRIQLSPLQRRNFEEGR